MRVVFCAYYEQNEYVVKFKTTNISTSCATLLIHFIRNIGILWHLILEKRYGVNFTKGKGLNFQSRKNNKVFL